MRLEELTRELPEATLRGDGSVEVGSVVHDSRQISKGALFVAVAGQRFDGHSAVAEAVAHGAAGVVVERAIGEGRLGVPVVEVPDTRQALGILASAFHGHPSRKLKVVGVTGTNGKTTTCYLLHAILRAWGRTTGLLGTIEYRVDGKTLGHGLTTPDGAQLQSLLFEMQRAGASHVVMEVSSHAIALKRIAGCDFSVGIFTNLGQDHLDFHHSLQQYAEAKRSFFTDYALRLGVVANVEQPLGALIAEQFEGRTFTYALDPSTGADLVAQVHRQDLDGASFTVRSQEGSLDLTTRLIGGHNISNILASIGAAFLLEVPRSAIIAGIERLQVIPGRLEPVLEPAATTFSPHKPKVLVDYAHTPDALGATLGHLRKLTAGRLIAVFGCGGDRDQGKRHEMGEIAGRNSDVVVVTSDNPRTEDPKQIARTIVEGIRASGHAAIDETQARMGERGYLVELERQQGIRLALGISRPQDLVLVAGKGHEAFQTVGATRRAFDDRQVVRNALEGWDEP